MTTPALVPQTQLAFDLFYIALSDRCNLSCVMCSTTKHPAEYEEGMKQAELPLEQWVKIIDNITRFKVDTISFGGGEPLLRKPDLDKLIPMIASRGIPINIITNATLLTRDFLGSIGQYKDKITFGLSVDGLEKETDQIRGAGVFNKVMAAAEYLQQAGWQFFFTSVLMPQNFFGFIDFLKFIHHKFPEAMAEIQPIIPHNEIYYIREKFALSAEHLDALKNILGFLQDQAIKPYYLNVTLTEEAFLNIVQCPNEIWVDLIKNGYIAADGAILEKFKNVGKAGEMALDPRLGGKKEEIFSAVHLILKNQQKLKITRPMGLINLYWDYFTNTLHTNNQCRMGTKSFNINRSGNLWICGKELEYPLYQYGIEEIFNTPEYRNEMKRVEQCTSSCFAGLVI